MLTPVPIFAVRNHEGEISLYGAAGESVPNQ